MDLDTFYARTAWHAHVAERRFEAPADPEALVPVDPGDVTAYTTDLRLDLGLGRVQGGDWDTGDARRQLEDTSTYETLHQRFVEGRDWTETALYERAAATFADGERFRGYDSLESFRETRLAYLDDLYESIATDGYRPNARDSHEPATAENDFETAYAHELEPLVAVARDGTVLLAEGFHRFVIARLQSLDAIPVQVLCRHEQWQQTRDAVAAARTDGEPESVASNLGTRLDHPDFQDLRP